MTVLEDLEYVRQRINPLPGDCFYLVLSDLLLALQNLLPTGLTRVLDYGCGGSPYRPLLNGCTYHRADLDGEDLDYQYGLDSRLPVGDGAYDFVLSTQVLEHVREPAVYLRECYRILRPQGRLLLTTHGTFEDHACPYDYWRWTGFGLQGLLEENGFKLQSGLKITTGPRAVLFLAERVSGRLVVAPGNLRHRSSQLALRLMRHFGTPQLRAFGARRLHEMADQKFAKNRIVKVEEFGHDIYIGLAMLAVRA
jgi:SAM-dependent methyltransferase